MSSVRSWDWSPVCPELCTLKSPGSNKYSQTVVGLIVSIEFGKIWKIFITDLSSHDMFGSNYTIEARIGSTNSEIPYNQILQVHAYNEKYGPFKDDLLKKRNLRLDEDYSKRINLLNEGIFVKADAKVKSYYGVIECVATKLETVDSFTFDPNMKVYENIIKKLPLSYFKYHRSTFEKTIPSNLIDKYLNERPDNIQKGNKSSLENHNPNTSISSSPLPPAFTPGKRIPPQQGANASPTIKTSRRASIPSDNTFQEDYELNALTMVRREPSNVSIKNKSFEPPKKKMKISLKYLERLNDIEEVDGKVYNVSGYIVEFEPLLRQLCIKSHIDEAPVLNPLTILIGATTKNNLEFDQLNENSIIKITFSTKSEILKFLGMTELEEVYIKSKEINDSFSNILNSKKIFSFKVIKKLIMVNNDRNFILGWESVDLTLQKLLDQE